jgi:hypothetical protein
MKHNRSVTQGLGFLFLLVAGPCFANDFGAYASNRIQPKDYFFKPMQSPQPKQKAIANLDVDLGIGSDCGNMDIRSSLKGSLENILNKDYFDQVGRDIIGAAPMLTVCYMSPTWCSILKSSRLEANLVTGTRLDQCKIIDSYADSRVQDFQAERQGCVRKKLLENGGNVDAATDACRGSLSASRLTSWSGDGEKVSENSLFDASAKWAGFTDKDERSTLNYLKATVGDTVVAQGRVSVRFGDGGAVSSPRHFLEVTSQDIEKKLCSGLVRRVSENPSQPLVYQVSDAELDALSLGTPIHAIDRRTIRSLSLLPPARRDQACAALARKLAVAIVAYQSNKGMEMMTTLLQNPHLLDHRKAELGRKREEFKDEVQAALAAENADQAPLRETLRYVNQEGQEQESAQIGRTLGEGAQAFKKSQALSALNDCSDRIFCE